jgi:hypothetical protein
LARRLARALAWLLAAWVVGSLAAVTLYRFVDPPLTPLMAIRVVETRLDGNPVGIRKQ